jgi:hypothetical protein
MLIPAGPCAANTAIAAQCAHHCAYV